jgi:UDP-GlcNAc:undecaprenyl-phosphate GlcNAc-1-phosphate transferase
MDGLITIIRRILNKQNPFKGDRGHLHHLLLNRGWSVSQIALFYWITTAILGLIAIYSSEKDLPLLVLTLGGVISFGIIMLNLKLDKRN